MRNGANTLNLENGQQIYQVTLQGFIKEKDGVDLKTGSETTKILNEPQQLRVTRYPLEGLGQ